jgi:hypothetical protein
MNGGKERYSQEKKERKKRKEVTIWLLKYF